MLSNVASYSNQASAENCRSHCVWPVVIGVSIASACSQHVCPVQQGPHPHYIKVQKHIFGCMYSRHQTYRRRPACQLYEAICSNCGVHTSYRYRRGSIRTFAPPDNRSQTQAPDNCSRTRIPSRTSAPDKRPFSRVRRQLSGELLSGGRRLSVGGGRMSMIQA